MKRNIFKFIFIRFDVDADFFTPSMRSRIIEFILKRKRLTEDVEDEFAFGIDKCLADGIYIAAYPLHDVRFFSFKYYCRFKGVS